METTKRKVEEDMENGNRYAMLEEEKSEMEDDKEEEKEKKEEMKKTETKEKLKQPKIDSPDYYPPKEAVDTNE